MSKSRLSLIIILALCMLSCLFAGCSIGFETYEEVLEKYNIAAQVTYYANGGCFNQNTAILSMEVEFTSGSKFLSVVEGTSVYNISRSNYDLVGWYYVQTRTITEVNEDGEEDVVYYVLDVTDEYVEENFAHTDASGNVVYYFEYTSELTTGTDDEEDDEEETSGSSSSSEEDDDVEADLSNLTNYMYYVKVNGEWLMSQDDYDYYVRIRKQNTDDDSINVPDLLIDENSVEVDSSLILEDDSHLYVVADWVKSASINYVLVMKEGETATSITVNGETVNVGDVIYREYFGTSTSISRSDASGFPVSVTLSDATVLAFYYDKECTQPVKGAAISKPAEDEDGNIPDVTIYALCVSGVYDVVRGVSDVVSMFNSGSDNYYFFDVDGGTVFDCSEVTVKPMSGLSGEIRGNGFTITNLVVPQTSLSANTSTALFGILQKGAKITDLTIDNVSITYYTTSVVQFVNIYLVGMVASGASSGDIDIIGLTLKNVTMDITLNDPEFTIINNIQLVNGVYESDNWLYGLRANYYTDKCVNDKDSEIVDTYGGATIEGATLIIHEGAYDQKTQSELYEEHSVFVVQI